MEREGKAGSAIKIVSKVLTQEYRLWNRIENPKIHPTALKIWYIIRQLGGEAFLISSISITK